MGARDGAGDGRRTPGGWAQMGVPRGKRIVDRVRAGSLYECRREALATAKE